VNKPKRRVLILCQHYGFLKRCVRGIASIDRHQNALIHFSSPHETVHHEQDQSATNFGSTHIPKTKSTVSTWIDDLDPERSVNEVEFRGGGHSDRQSARPVSFALAITWRAPSLSRRWHRK
jgi:hypothetical protein